MFPWEKFFNNEAAPLGGNPVKPQDVERFVQNMMEKTMPKDWDQHFPIQAHQEPRPPENSQQNDPVTIPIQVLETFHFIYVRLTLLQTNWAENLKIFYTGNKVILENIPKEGSRQEILLPAPVKKRGASAERRGNIMEISFPVSDDWQFAEVQWKDTT
ncbi:MAG TPA: hypothetical protein VEY51_09145 [Chondromyces sp.]|nr:hypothetical protein [Chondromyces sp.]